MDMADILVVEDNIEMGTLLCDFLQAEGYTTEHCTDGADALDMFVDSGAKLVILDIMLPHLDGYGICKKNQGNFKCSGHHGQCQKHEGR